MEKEQGTQSRQPDVREPLWLLSFLLYPWPVEAVSTVKGPTNANSNVFITKGSTLLENRPGNLKREHMFIIGRYHKGKQNNGFN